MRRTHNNRFAVVVCLDSSLRTSGIENIEIFDQNFFKLCTIMVNVYIGDGIYSEIRNVQFR